jgi:hypothetical protein
MAIVAICAATCLFRAGAAPGDTIASRATNLVDGVLTPTVPITVLPPSIEYVDIVTGAPRKTEPVVIDSLATFIVQTACARLDRVALICAGPRARVVDADTTELQRFISQSERNIAAKDLASWSTLLGSIAAGDSTRLVLIHHLRVKVGPGGFWDPFSGAIGNATSSTIVSAAVVECSTGRVIRRIETLVRRQPDPGSKPFVEALRSTYEKFH